MLIVFLFLNSWRSTVITGLTLPIALIGTFLFMYAFGFSINMVTLMALSLCVGLLIDDAIVVRENIVRHVQMGKPPYQAAAGRHAGDRPGGAGHHLLHRRGVPAHRLHGRHHRQVLPRVRRHHRRRGADLDVRELHARPDAVVGVARPGGRGHGKPKAQPGFYDRSIGRVTGWFDRATERLAEAYQAHPALVAGAQARHRARLGRRSSS